LVTNPNLATTTLSPSGKSALLADQLQIVARIQSPFFAKQPLFTEQTAVLQVMISENAPRYLDSANKTVVLNLTDSESTTFVFQRSGGSFANYTQMVGELRI